MCLLVVASGVVDGWPLVVAANRDEWLDRPAAPVQQLAPGVVGGRDLLAGGTWLAAGAVVAGLTNQPSPAGRDPAKRSRGEIPLALAAATDAGAAVAAFRATYRPGTYNPCWVLVGDRHGLWYLDLTDPDRLGVAALAPGVHVLENRPLGQASPKVDRVRELLEAAGGPAGDPARWTPQALQPVLADHTVTDPGAADPRRRLASACCVHADGYGTRSAMVVRVPAAGPAEVWAADGPPCTTPLAPVDP
ncbi:MAG TPA: NRDE family protein [Acidimicrobiales bacterium]|nr:NRDE family protein [Acidimicrobiales bacterium]